MTQCDEENITQFFMNVRWKLAMRLEEAGAPETSVTNYETICCRNSE